ncbi:hypothetical protein BD779DRAFT_1409473, partial [Infundibulicybe gibba]
SPTAVRSLGFRTQGYRPDPHEYTHYMDKRARVLRGPAGRAALMKGGIIWRLAMDTESVNAMDVHRGPSEESRWFGQRLGTDNHYDCSIIDDALDESECEVICGVYQIDMGKGNGRKHSSWWPRQSTWDGSGFCVGQWTPDAEAWYQSRLEEIRTGKAELYSATEWGKKLKF